MRHRHRYRQQIKESTPQIVQSTTIEAREFLTAAIARDREIAAMIEDSIPDLRFQLSEIWVDYIAFLRTEFGEEETIDHWRLFCEYSTITAEVECQ